MLARESDIELEDEGLTIFRPCDEHDDSFDLFPGRTDEDEVRLGTKRGDSGIGEWWVEAIWVFRVVGFENQQAPGCGRRTKLPAKPITCLAFPPASSLRDTSEI